MMTSTILLLKLGLSWLYLTLKISAASSSNPQVSSKSMQVSQEPQPLDSSVLLNWAVQLLSKQIWLHPAMAKTWRKKDSFVH